MLFHVFPVRTGKMKSSIEFTDLRLATSSDDEQEAVSLMLSVIDNTVYDRIVILNSSTYSMNEVKI